MLNFQIALEFVAGAVVFAMAVSLIITTLAAVRPTSLHFATVSWNG